MEHKTSKKRFCYSRRSSSQLVKYKACIYILLDLHAYQLRIGFSNIVLKRESPVLRSIIYRETCRLKNLYYIIFTRIDKLTLSISRYLPNVTPLYSSMKYSLVFSQKIMGEHNRDTWTNSICQIIILGMNIKKTFMMIYVLSAYIILVQSVSFVGEYVPSSECRTKT